MLGDMTVIPMILLFQVSTKTEEWTEVHLGTTGELEGRLSLVG